MSDKPQKAPKSAEYHQDAVEYNRVMAETAEKLSRDIGDSTVSGWCASIGRQHRFHETKHNAALGRMDGSEQQESTDAPAPMPAAPTESQDRTGDNPDAAPVEIAVNEEN